MESDGHRLYSVHTRTEIHEKMMKEIIQISEVFSLSQSDATVILIHLGWNSFKASDLLGDDKERFLSKLGLVQVLGDSSADHDGDNLVSTPFCSHKFCTDCWRDYLSESLEKKKNEDDKRPISCFNCVASVGPDTIEKLSEPVKKLYERYVLGSFMESNKESIKWCPEPSCNYAIERLEDPSEDESNDFGVVCLCGHTFCWTCQLESHRPVTCNNASLWCNELLDKARNLVWITMKTKRCPSCNILVAKNNELRYVTCICRFTFCWLCLQSDEEHDGISSCIELSVPIPSNDSALMHHLKLWEESDEAMQKSKHDLKATERTIPILTGICGLAALDIRALREAWMLIVQCRLVLKWSCVFGYFLTDYHIAKKQYLDHLREEATANLVKHKETIDKVVNGAISGGVSIGFSYKLEATTKTTGNYFHFFVKTLEDGLCDVKVDAYEDVSTDYWFCDRCTFQNDCFDYKCRMCVEPFEPATRVVVGNSNNTRSAQKEQVSNVPDNPSAKQGWTNPFLSPPLKAFGNNNSTASNITNPFAGQGGTNPFLSPPLMAFGINNNNTSSGHQHQVPNNPNSPFAHQGRTYPLGFRRRPVAFGNNSSSASGQHQQGPSMPNDSLDRQGATDPWFD